MSGTRAPSNAIINGTKCAVFKNPTDEPYGGFANTTNAGDYPIKQTITVNGKPQTFKWASSEAAYHAQKLIHLMNKPGTTPQMKQALMETLRTIERTKTGPGEQFMPRDDFDPIVKKMIDKHSPAFGADKTAFDAMCDSNYHSKHNPGGGLKPDGTPYTHDFMRDVIKMKLDQNPKLKALAMQMARDGVMPVEFSRYDYNWASGPDGSGENMLGIIILEEGNRLLRENGETPAIPDPKAHYKNMQQKNASALSHDNVQKAQMSLDQAQIMRATAPRSVTPVTRQTKGHRQPASRGNPYAKHKAPDRHQMPDRVSAKDAALKRMTEAKLDNPKAVGTVISNMVNQMMGTKGGASGNIPVVAMGDENGTLKFAFDNKDDAKAFFDALGKGNNTSFYPDGDKYPMQNGNTELPYIVRFENDGEKGPIPEAAREFLHQKFGKDADILIKQMGFDMPEPSQSMRMGSS